MHLLVDQRFTIGIDIRQLFFSRSELFLKLTDALFALFNVAVDAVDIAEHQGLYRGFPLLLCIFGKCCDETFPLANFFEVPVWTV